MAAPLSPAGWAGSCYLPDTQHTTAASFRYFANPLIIMGGSVAEWLACWAQAQKGLGSNRSRDAVG